MLPLQLGIPGGPELLVILFIGVLLFGLPVVLVLLLLKKGTGGDNSVEELEQRVEELETELEEDRSYSTRSANPNRGLTSSTRTSSVSPCSAPGTNSV